MYSPYEIAIHGTISKGKVFRPSDWAERLYGTLSPSNKDDRLPYLNWMQPILVDEVRCVAMGKKLEEANPPVLRFLIDFTADDDLHIIDYKWLPEECENGIQETASGTQALLAQTVEEKHAAKREESVLPIRTGAEAAETMLCEITAEEAAIAFAALGVLHLTLTDTSHFAKQISTRQRAAGYRLFGISGKGKYNAMSVCGFYEAFNLASGRHSCTDNIVTLLQSHNKGYVSRLLREMCKTAAGTGIAKIHLNVHIDQEHTLAHRLYFSNGFSISAYHFRRDVQ